MNALRIKRRFDAPIPQLPEMNPLIGKQLEIIVLEEPAPTTQPVDLTALDTIAGTDAMDFDAVEELRRISTI